jgi:hypothetical protein
LVQACFHSIVVGIDDLIREYLRSGGVRLPEIVLLKWVPEQREQAHLIQP